MPPTLSDLLAPLSVADFLAVLRARKAVRLAMTHLRFYKNT